MRYSWEYKSDPNLAVLFVDWKLPIIHGAGTRLFEPREERESETGCQAKALGESLLSIRGIEEFQVPRFRRYQLRIEKSAVCNWKEITPTVVDFVAHALGQTENVKIDLTKSDSLEPREKLNARFPRSVLVAIRLVLTAERLASATQKVLDNWDDQNSYTQLRSALTAYDKAKTAAIRQPDFALKPKA